MSWLSQNALKRTYGFVRKWQTPPSSSLATLSTPKSSLACRCLALRAMSSYTTGKRLIDNDIPFRVARLVDPESNSLHPLAPLQFILNSIDRKTHHIELVADAPDPIVKIVDTKQAREKYKEAKKRGQAAARAQVRKEVQVTWAVAAGDLAHKLEKVRRELVGGRKVVLIFTSRKGQVVPTKQEMDTRLKDVLETLADAGKEYLPREQRGNMATLHLKPPKQS